MALLSLPYKWGDPGFSHHVTDEMVEEWTDSSKLKRRLIVKGCHCRPGRVKSIIRISKQNYLLLFYEF